MTRKFRVLARAQEYPFKCIITGKATNVVDMGKYVEDYGYVYLHVSVVAALASAHNLQTPDNVSDLIERSKLLDTVLGSLRDSVEAMRDEIVRNVDTFVGSITGSTLDSDDTVGDTDVETVEAVGAGTDSDRSTERPNEGDSANERVRVEEEDPTET